MATGGVRRPAFGAQVLLACMVLLLAPVAAGAATFDCNANEAPQPSDITIALDPATPWQPRGGNVRVIVQSATQALKDVEVTICFRWSGAGNRAKYLPPAAVHLVEFTAAKAVYSVTVPDGGSLPAVKSTWFERLSGAGPADPTQPTHFDNLMIVPIADAVVMVGTSDSLLASTVLQVGVTSVWNACVVTLVAVLIAQGLLYLWAVRRQVPGRSPWMRLISTREGYASLSQLQIMIWSFLFGAGAVYVMILSGSLFNIPTSALVLLGIAGATTVGAKIQAANANADTPADPQLPRETTAPDRVQNLRAIATTDHSVTLQWDEPGTGRPRAVYALSFARQDLADWQVANERIDETSYRVARLLPGKTYLFRLTALNAGGSSAATEVSVLTQPAAPTARKPMWSDLVVTPQHPGEIDVTRVQMLFFTLISAAFVAIKLITGFAIPEIPEGFMLLMGISNGVYLSAKFVPD
jgi:hypothetical protein